MEISELVRIRNIPYKQRGDLRTLSAAINVPVTYMYRLVWCGAIKRYSSTLKPFLKEANKMERIKFALSHIDHNDVFDPVYDKKVHVDAEWFFMKEVKSNTY